MVLQKLMRMRRIRNLLSFSKYEHNWVLYTVKRCVQGYGTKLRFITPFTMMSLSLGIIQRKDNEDTKVKTRELVLAKADALYDQGKYQEIYDLLQNYKDSNDVEILWRMCRTLYKMSMSADAAKAKEMIYEAYDLACTALNIKEDHYAVHKWISILLDSKSSYEGMKSRIKQLHNVKKHMLRATELNPKDATTLYMLGNWCYQVSDLAWYQRKIASTIFAEPPVSSFEEALQYFETAETVDPNFYSHNLLMLGKTYLKLNRKEEALKYLKKASEFPARNDDDHRATQEAQKLLKNI